MLDRSRRAGVPLNWRFRLVRAERAGPQRVLEVAPQSRVRAGDLPDRAPNPPRHRGARALGAAAQPARPTAQAERPGQDFDDAIELLASTFGARCVVHLVSLVDFVLEIADTLLNFAAGALVQHAIGIAALARPVGELETVDFLAALREQPRKIVEPLLIGELRGES